MHTLSQPAYRALEIQTFATGFLHSQTTAGLALYAPPSLPLPDLTHTRLRRVLIGKQSYHRLTWNQLNRELLYCYLETRAERELLRLQLRGVVAGRLTERGFHYLDGHDVSARLSGANQAAENVSRVGQILGLPVIVDYIHPRDRRTTERLKIA